MSRPIKFRAWDGKEMIRSIDVYSLGHNYSYLKDELTLMQFTGLTDKNGKEIYEGDIVKTESGTFEVWWFNLGACFRYDDGHGNVESPLNYDDVEIIGNIYENPELIQKTP